MADRLHPRRLCLCAVRSTKLLSTKFPRTHGGAISSTALTLPCFVPASPNLRQALARNLREGRTPRPVFWEGDICPKRRKPQQVGWMGNSRRNYSLFIF